MAQILTAIETSLMLNKGANVKKNWLKAAHFHCRLSSRTSEVRKLEVGRAGEGAWEVAEADVTARARGRRGMAQGRSMDLYYLKKSEIPGRDVLLLCRLFTVDQVCVVGLVFEDNLYTATDMWSNKTTLLAKNQLVRGQRAGGQLWCSFGQAQLAVTVKKNGNSTNRPRKWLCNHLIFCFPSLSPPRSRLGRFR